MDYVSNKFPGDASAPRLQTILKTKFPSLDYVQDSTAAMPPNFSHDVPNLSFSLFHDPPFMTPHSNLFY